MDKGIDILLPQFKMLRDQTEFFTHLYNWFMPFYLKNPHITEALGFVDEKRKFCKAFCSTARSCPADAYSLANLIVSHPNEIPENIVDCYDDPEDEEDGSESADEEEIVKEFLMSLKSIVQSVSVSTTSAISCASPSSIQRRMKSSISSMSWMMTNQPMPSWRVLFSG